MEGPQGSARQWAPHGDTRSWGHGDMGACGHGDMGTMGAWGHAVTSRPLPRGQRDPMALKGQCAHLAGKSPVTVTSRPFLVDMGTPRGIGDTRGIGDMGTPRDVTPLAPGAKRPHGASKGQCAHLTGVTVASRPRRQKTCVFPLLFLQPRNCYL